jgi:hypothetical protein
MLGAKGVDFCSVAQEKLYQVQDFMVQIGPSEDKLQNCLTIVVDRCIWTNSRIQK